MPYVTWLKKWHRLFVQAFGLHCIQMADMDHTIDGVSCQRVLGPNVITFNVAVSYWAYRNPNMRYLSSIIPTDKFHYQMQLEDEGWRLFNNLIVLHLRRDILTLDGGRCCCCHTCFFNYTNTIEFFHPKNKQVLKKSVFAGQNFIRKYSYLKIKFCLCISKIISKLLFMQEPTNQKG